MAEKKVYDVDYGGGDVRRVDLTEQQHAKFQRAVDHPHARAKSIVEVDAAGAGDR